MIVCVCHRVSDREIFKSACSGATFEQVRFELGVGTQCGSCESMARGLCARAQQAREALEVLAAPCRIMDTALGAYSFCTPLPHELLPLVRPL